MRACLDLPSKIASRTASGVREGVAEVFVDLLHVRPEVREDKSGMGSDLGA